MRSISACCFSIARPSASSRAACSLRHACQVPSKKRARPASSSSTAVPTVSRNQRSWATRTMAASSSSSVCSSHSSDSMSRWLVGSSSSSRSGWAASARASEPRVSWPPENVVSGAVEVVVGEAEAVDDRARALAPAVAAGGLEARLHAGVAVHRRLVAVGHRVLEAPQLGLELERLAAAAEHVVAQASGRARAAGAGRAGRRACPWPAPARRRRSTSRPTASAAASSCPRRCARRWSCGRAARA